MKKNNVLFALMSVFFIGCSSSDNNELIYGDYAIKEVIADIPIDINFDGVSNNDLTKELASPLISTLALYDYECPVIFFYWMEPMIDNRVFLSELPLMYTDDMVLNYVPVQHEYYFSFDSNNKTIVSESKVVTDSKIYSFEFPEKLSYNPRKKEISFTARQKFLTKEGIRTVFLSFKYGFRGDH